MRNRVSDVFGPAADCPSDEDLLKRSDASGDAAGKELWERHLATCPYCTARLELFRTFESGKPAVEEQQAVGAIVAVLRRNSPAHPEPWWSRMWRPRILAPAVLILAAASVLMIINLNPRGRS